MRARGGSRQRGPAAPYEGLRRGRLATPMGRPASAEAPPAPPCLPGESGLRGRWWGRRPGRASTSPVGSGPGPDLVRLQLSLAAPTSLFNREATAWVRGGRKTRPTYAGGSAVLLCVFPVTSYLCKRRRLFALGDNVSRERKSVLVNSSARDPKCLWLGEVLLTLSPGGSNPPWAGQGSAASTGLGRPRCLNADALLPVFLEQSKSRGTGGAGIPSDAGPVPTCPVLPLST